MILGEKFGSGFKRLALGLVFGALLTLIPIQTAAALTFTAIGDMPYFKADQIALEGDIPEAIKAHDPAFVVHYGDLKGGGEACSVELLEERRETIYGLLPGHVFYTPGDNEWADCDRRFLDTPVSELGQLDRVRETMFPAPLDLPSDWAYTTQANYPENARWIADNVLFVTLHMISTNNGREEILLDDLELALAEVDARDQANRVWLDAAFEEALDVGAKAVVVVTQADVTGGGSGACTPYNRIHCDAFANFRDQLSNWASDFRDRGQPRRPVLLIHGDTNPYCLDRDFGGERAGNLWRLNAWGDYQSPADATLVTFDPENGVTPFQIQTLVHGIAPDSDCYGFN